MSILSNALNAKQFRNLSNISSIIAKSVKDGRDIREADMYNFTKLIIWVISEDIEFLPESFYELENLISGVYHYPTDERGIEILTHSYLRIYQLFQLVSIRKSERESERKINRFISNHSDDISILKSIYNNSIRTFDDLMEDLEMPDDELRKRINRLVEEDFVIFRDVIKPAYYALTNDGEGLYLTLKFQQGILK